MKPDKSVLTLIKSANGYKNSYASENAITVRAILKTTEALMHQPGRRSPQGSSRWRSVEDGGILGSSNLQIYTISMTSQQSIDKVCQKKSLFGQ